MIYINFYRLWKISCLSNLARIKNHFDWLTSLIFSALTSIELRSEQSYSNETLGTRSYMYIQHILTTNPSKWIIWFHKKMSKLVHLHNYFNLHVCPSFRRRRRRRPTFDFQIPAVVSQSVTNKSCLICVDSEKYALLVTTKPLGSMR